MQHIDKQRLFFKKKERKTQLDDKRDLDQGIRMTDAAGYS